MALRKLTLFIGALLVFGSSQTVFAESMYGGLGKKVLKPYPALPFRPETSSLMPGRKLLLQSIWAAVSADSSTLFDPFTMSTRYLNLNDRPSALAPHHLGLSL